MVNAAVLVEGRIRRRAEPHLPVFFVERFLADRPRESGSDVPETGAADVANLADVAVADQFDALFVLLARTLLRAALHNPFVVLGLSVLPAAFADECVQRL